MGSIVHITGARPNFMKCIPLYRELEKRGKEQVIIHSGQHYDYNMSGVFFKQFGIKPDINLGVAAHGHAQTIGNITAELEQPLKKLEPQHVVVYGDVNTTLAGAIVASKMGITLHHVEAGLRSGDKSMPEETTRIMVDSVSDHLYAPTLDAWGNVNREQYSYYVGNIMIDCIKMFERHVIEPEERGYVFVTLHRPSNVDNPVRMNRIVHNLNMLGKKIIFPKHPRTHVEGIETIPPIDYFRSLGYQKCADLVITDSGGVQAESAYFGTPCLTLRDSKEWIFSTLIEPEQMHVTPVNFTLPDMWDGKTSKRIARVLCE